MYAAVEYAVEDVAGGIKDTFTKSELTNNIKTLTTNLAPSALTRHEGYNEEWLELQYQDKEGKTFPYIHQLTSIFKPERIPMESYEVNIKQYLDYASLALVLRGIYWWTAIIAGLLLGYVFPIACSLGKRINLNGNIGVINYSRGWENQELVYGLFQGIIFWIVIFIGN